MMKLAGNLKSPIVEPESAGKMEEGGKSGNVEEQEGEVEEVKKKKCRGKGRGRGGVEHQEDVEHGKEKIKGGWGGGGPLTTASHSK